MRAILFRGKIDPDAYSYDRKSEWVYGYYTKYSVIFFGRSVIEQEKDDYAVLDDTVCQYTGLNDKNGTKIFEGDIVKTEQIIPVLGTNIFAVEYAHGNYFIRYNSTVLSLFSVNESAEVIGNIFDNLELLEKGD